MRVTTIVIGSVIFVLSIAAMLLFGRILNPPAQQVYVAVREIQAGESLTPDLVRLEAVRIPSTAPFVTSADIQQYGYARVVEPIHQRMFIPKAALSFADNPAADNRVALALGDPNLVAMAIPVTPLTCPSPIVPGDRVSLDVSVGSVNLLSGNFSAAAPTPVGSGLTGLANSSALGVGSPTGANPMVLGTPTPTPVPQPGISLPITKDLVVSGRVLQVLYNQQFNPVTLQNTNSSAASQTIQGDIKALVVAVPTNLQEALAFAIANGDVRVAVLDPNAKAAQNDLTAGMSWDDLVAYFAWQRQEWLKTTHPTDPVSPPGAAALWPSLNDPQMPEPSPMPVPTKQP